MKGRQYRVWPTYDFASPVEDSVDGVTHALRTKEYELRDEPYYFIITRLGLRKPQLIEFSRLEMEGTPVSKRKLGPLVQQGLVQGWDDPRMPTLAGLKRRGFTPASIRQFILSLGVTKAESEPTWDLLESYNRKILDPKTKRYFFVPAPVRLEVPDAPSLTLTLKHHPEFDLGRRVMKTSTSFYIPRSDFRNLRLGDEFRLMEAFNVKVVDKGEDWMKGSYANAEVRDILKVQWVPEVNLEFKVLTVGPLYVGEEFNARSLAEIRGYAESACQKLEKGEQVQFVRFGFCRIDAPGVAILTHK